MASGPNRAWHCPPGAFLCPLECTECSGGTVPKVTKTLWLAASVEKIPQECWAKISYNWMVIPGPEEAKMEGTKPTLFSMHNI